MKFNSTTKTFKGTLEQSFSMLWAVLMKCLTKQYSKMVVRKPSWIFQSFQMLHSWKYNPTWTTLEKQTSKILAFCYEIWRNYKQNSKPRWWSGRHLEYFSHSKNYIYENITLYERPCMKQTSKFSAFYIEIWWNYQQNSNPRWWSDAILNISIILKATFTKMSTPTWMSLHETNQRNFNLLWWDLKKISTKQ